MNTATLNQIVSFLNTNPRNRLIILKNKNESDFLFTDIGFELATALKNSTQNKQVSMLASDALEGIINQSEKTHPLIGKYVALTNIGILMEDALKINVPTFLNSNSQNRSFLLKWDGELSDPLLYFLSKENGKTINLKGISHIITYEV